MSVFQLERLFDPPATVEAREREREQDLQGSRTRDPKPRWFRCRVCAFESTEGEYCPHCVADTMVLGARREDVGSGVGPDVE
jgi:rubrerythrin